VPAGPPAAPESPTPALRNAGFSIFADLATPQRIFNLVAPSPPGVAPASPRCVGAPEMVPPATPLLVPGSSPPSSSSPSPAPGASSLATLLVAQFPPGPTPPSPLSGGYSGGGDMGSHNCAGRQLSGSGATQLPFVPSVGAPVAAVLLRHGPGSPSSCEAPADPSATAATIAGAVEAARCEPGHVFHRRRFSDGGTVAVAAAGAVVVPVLPLGPLLRPSSTTAALETLAVPAAEPPATPAIPSSATPLSVLSRPAVPLLRLPPRRFERYDGRPNAPPAAPAPAAHLEDAATPLVGPPPHQPPPQIGAVQAPEGALVARASSTPVAVHSRRVTRSAQQQAGRPTASSSPSRGDTEPPAPPPAAQPLPPPPPPPPPLPAAQPREKQDAPVPSPVRQPPPMHGHRRHTRTNGQHHHHRRHSVSGSGSGGALRSPSGGSAAASSGRGVGGH